jgi:hypothetical protein
MLRAEASVTQTFITLRRPRDYDIQILEQAALSNTDGWEGMLVRLWKSSYFLDRGETPEAIQATLEAETICEGCYATIQGELLASFVFDHALLRSDAQKARLWWDRMEARKPDPDSIDREWARTALLWIEGRYEEAREALHQGEVQARELPDFGAYEFDRYHFQLLRGALDAARLLPLEPKQLRSQQEASGSDRMSHGMQLDLRGDHDSTAVVLESAHGAQ